MHWSRAPAFEVEAGIDATVWDLKKVIAATEQVSLSPHQVSLYWGLGLDLNWPREFTRSDCVLLSAINQGTVVEMQNCTSLRCYHPDVTPRREGAHLLVKPDCQVEDTGGSPDSNEPPKASCTDGITCASETRIVPQPTTPGPVENLRLEELWRYSALDERGIVVPGVLPPVLQRPLPFRLQTRNQDIADDIFAEYGPELRCDELSSLIEAVAKSVEEEKTKPETKRSWESVNDQLLRLTSRLCKASGFTLKLDRQGPVLGADSDSKPRPDAIVTCNECVVLCGGESHAPTETEDTLMRLLGKMKLWSPMFYGELHYVLGYVVCGDKWQLFAYFRDEWKYLVPLLKCSSTAAIKIFYNLAFVLGAMTKFSKVTLPAPLSPFKVNESRVGTIELMAYYAMQLTIRRELCRSGGEYKRLVEIYQNLERVWRSSYATTHLPHVRKLQQQNHFRARKVVVELFPAGFHRLPENVLEVHTWLQHILTALKYWHGSGYCHGDIQWRNIMYMTSPGFHPGNWFLVNMETSTKSEILVGKTWKYQTTSTCRKDLFQLGVLLNELHRTHFALTDKLLWVRDRLLSTGNDSELVTATKMLAVLDRMKNSPTESLLDVVSSLLLLSRLS